MCAWSLAAATILKGGFWSHSQVPDGPHVMPIRGYRGHALRGATERRSTVRCAPTPGAHPRHNGGTNNCALWRGPHCSMDRGERSASKYPQKAAGQRERRRGFSRVSRAAAELPVAGRVLRDGPGAAAMPGVPHHRREFVLWTGPRCQGYRHLLSSIVDEHDVSIAPPSPDG